MRKMPVKTSGPLLLLALAMALPPAVATAAVNVGDKPNLAFMAVDGKAVSSQSLAGKIVVVDFWATWCGPCMAEGDHMVALHKKYGPQGMQMIGISLDQDVAEMKQVAKEKGFDWPQACDGKGWGTPLAQAWGVKGIPATFILGPDGTVLWSGHPGGIDAPLDKAFREHPPQLVDPKVLAAAKTALDAAQTALKANDAKAALKQFAKIGKDARADKAFDAQAQGVRKELETAADALLAGVDPLVAKGEFVEAVASLTDLSASLGDLPAGKAAKAKLAALSARPDVKAKLAEAERVRVAAEKAKAADELLAAANALRSAKRDELAYPKFKQIATDHAATPAGKQAAANVATYEKDAAFMKRAREAAGAQKANSTLGVARSYKSAGRNDLAKKKFQSIIDEFPGTSFAETARKEMAGL